MVKERSAESLSTQERIDNTSEVFMKAFESVVGMRSAEEDLDRAANSLLELGVQPFHMIRSPKAFKEPVEFDGRTSDIVNARLALLRKVGSGDLKFDEELDRFLSLRSMTPPSSDSDFPGARDVYDKDTLLRITAFARALKDGSVKMGDMSKAPLREGFLSNAFTGRKVREAMAGRGWNGNDPRTVPIGSIPAPGCTNWSYWFDWLYFLFAHPEGPDFHEPPQCMNCGRGLDDQGAQVCPGCGEDPWQWWFQWFYARHAPEDLLQRSWDVFQIHTFSAGSIHHPRTEGWISSLTHIPIREEGRFRVDVTSTAFIDPLGLNSPSGMPLDLDIWHSVAFGPYPATSIRHPVYLDRNDAQVEYAHRSPFERLVMREAVDIGSGELRIETMSGTEKVVRAVQGREWKPGPLVASSTIDTDGTIEGNRPWSALTPAIEGPGVVIVREEVTYILEDPSARDYRSIDPCYTGQPGGWFEPLIYRVRGIE